MCLAHLQYLQTALASSGCFCWVGDGNIAAASLVPLVGGCVRCAPRSGFKRRPHSRMGRVIHTGARSPGPWSRSRPNLESRNGSVTPDALHPHAGCNFGPKVACKRFCCPIRASQRLGPETKWYAPSPGFPLDHQFGLAEPRKTPKVLRSFEIGRMSLLIPCRPLRAYLHGQ